MMNNLTSKERMARIRKREKIDRVPVNISGQLYCARISGISFKEFWTVPEKAFQAVKLAGELHDFDSSPSYTYGWPDWIVSEVGGEVEFSDDKYGMPKIVKRPIEKPSDTERLKFPDPKTAPVMSRRLQCDRLNVQNGGKAEILGGISRMVGAIAGFDKILRWYYTDPTAVHLLYRKVVDYLKNIINLYIKEFGAENCKYFEAAPMDSQNVISPKTFEKFGFIYYDEVHKKLYESGIPVSEIHLCGNHAGTIHLWKKLAGFTGTSISIGNEMDISKTADFLGENYIISGNVPTQLLHYGSAEEVLAKCKEIIEKVKYHPGGFILRTACGMPAETPPVNVNAMIKAAKLYGKYE